MRAREDVGGDAGAGRQGPALVARVGEDGGGRSSSEGEAGGARILKVGAHGDREWRRRGRICVEEEGGLRRRCAAAAHQPA